MLRSLCCTFERRGRGEEQEEEEQEGFAKMEEEPSFPDLSDFEFFLAIYHNSWEKLVHKS